MEHNDEDDVINFSFRSSDWKIWITLISNFYYIFLNKRLFMIYFSELLLNFTFEQNNYFNQKLFY